jgi:hypothetical protein
MSNKLFQQLEGATARIETLLHIGGMITDCCSIPESFREMLEDQSRAELEEIFPGIPDWAVESIDDNDLTEFLEWLHEEDRFGFLVQFATPVMEGSEDFKTYSWGYYGTRWVYSESLEEAIELGLKWVAERRAKELRKSTP